MNYRRGANSRVVRKKKIEYESALQAEGINPVFLARKLEDLLGAQAPRWNPKTKSWEKFEDYDAQLAAFSETAKLLDIYPVEDDMGDVGVKVVLVGVPRPGQPIGSGEHSVATAVLDDWAVTSPVAPNINVFIRGNVEHGHAGRKSIDSQCRRRRRRQ